MAPRSVEPSSRPETLVLGSLVCALDGPVGRLAHVVGSAPTADGAGSGIFVIDVGDGELRAVPGSRLDDVDVEARVLHVRCTCAAVTTGPVVAHGGVADVGLLLAEVVAHYFRRRSLDEEGGTRASPGAAWAGRAPSPRRPRSGSG